MFTWLKVKLRISELQAELATLESNKAEILLNIAKLDAAFEERNKLFEAWNTIHADHKETITALLAAIQNKAK